VWVSISSEDVVGVREAMEEELKESVRLGDRVTWGLALSTQKLGFDWGGRDGWIGATLGGRKCHRYR